MHVGDVFTINDVAITALEAAGHSTEWAVGKGDDKKMFKLESGMQFRIAKNGLKLMPTELRASRLDSVSGKAIRGRPRKFPGKIVADLMGESLTQFSTAPATPVASSAATPATTTPAPQAVTPVDTVEVDDTEQTEEEKRESREKVEALFGVLDDDSTDDDWV